MNISSREKVALMAVGMGLLILLVVGTLGAAPPEVPEEKPLAALYAVTWNMVAITSTTTSTAYTTQSYAYHDLFCAIDANENQTITVKYQVSPDNSNWFESYWSAGYSADASFFTRTLAYGRYSRMKFEVQTGNAITPVCKSVFSNNWAPANYLQEANQQ